MSTTSIKDSPIPSASELSFLKFPVNRIGIMVKHYRMNIGISINF